ncbi:MAG: DEAD/DEAH box helicase domain-containing protein, partial [Microgenomates group bacterium Gr01-1014_16]
MFELFFDIETKSFFDDTGNGDPAQLGVSIVSVYFRETDDQTGEMVSFWEHQIPDMWSLFRKADRIIGFNTLGFDVPVLKPYAPSDFAKLPHFDIYSKIKEFNLGHAASLNRIAKDTLSLFKIDNPANTI